MATVLSSEETLAVIIAVMIANGAPVLARGRGKPLDLGRNFIDGRRLFGDGKTFEGSILAMLGGYITGLMVFMFTSDVLVLTVTLYAVPAAICGDILAAFFKRRLNLPRGYPLLIVDQLDFYVASMTAVYLAGYLLDPILVFLFAPIIYLLHRTTNIAAHRLGLKNVPW